MWSLSNIQVSETGTPTEPVSLPDLKLWVKLDDITPEEEAELIDMGISAREDIERELEIKLVGSTASFYLTTTNDSEEITDFPFAGDLSQVSAVVVSLINDGQADETQTVDEDYYFNGSLKIGSAGRNKISYTITPVVPNTLKEAIKMLVAYRYSNRGDQQDQQGIPDDILTKIWKYKKISV